MTQEPTAILVLSHGKQEQVVGWGNQVGGPTGITADRQTGAQSAKSPGQDWYACASPDQGTGDPGQKGNSTQRSRMRAPGWWPPSSSLAGAKTAVTFGSQDAAGR